MSKFKVGDRVRATSTELHNACPNQYPEVNTIGRVVATEIGGDVLMIQWPLGSTSDDDHWCCLSDVVELIKAAPDTAQQAKRDADKPRPSLVPSQIIWDIAEVREYGNAKYGAPDNWRQVELQRYIDALYRHMLAFVADPASTDDESGLRHYKHMACNMAFICDMMARKED